MCWLLQGKEKIKDIVRTYCLMTTRMRHYQISKHWNTKLRLIFWAGSGFYFVPQNNCADEKWISAFSKIIDTVQKISSHYFTLIINTQCYAGYWLLLPVLNELICPAPSHVELSECLHKEFCPVSSRIVWTWTIVNAFTKSFVRCHHGKFERGS